MNVRYEIRVCSGRSDPAEGKCVVIGLLLKGKVDDESADWWGE